MLKTSEPAMPKTRKVTTVCNGNREVCNDYEEAKRRAVKMAARSFYIILSYAFSALTIPRFK